MGAKQSLEINIVAVNRRQIIGAYYSFTYKYMLNIVSDATNLLEWLFIKFK